MGRDTMGVKGMTIKEGEALLGMEIAPNAGTELFVVTERGYGKRTTVADYPQHHRGGQGVRTIQVTPKKGPIVGMKIVSPAHELMLISEEGVVIRVRAEDISKLGRSTQGVKVMNVSESDHVSAIARVTGGNRKKAPRVAEGQGLLVQEETIVASGEADEAEDEAETLVAEEFEDAEDAEATEADE